MDPREGAAWLGLVGVLELLPPALDAQLQADAGLTHFEFIVLSNLRFAESGTMQMKELAAATNTTPARLSHVVTKLSARGAVEKVPREHDGRSHDLVLTAGGRRLLVRATARHIDFVRASVIDRLSEDQLEVLTSVCRTITDQLDPLNRTGHLRATD